MGRTATVDDGAEFGQAQPCYSTDQSARRNAKTRGCDAEYLRRGMR